jgi:hypothetical protein
MPFKSSRACPESIEGFKGSRTDKKDGVARFDNSQNVKVSLSTASDRLNGREVSQLCLLE